MAVLTDVEKFIGRFLQVKYPEGVIEAFTSGCCYWFALILCGRFPEAVLMYDIVANHFVASINNRLYDITGDVTDKYTVVEWESYDDELHKARIIRDCINF